MKKQLLLSYNEMVSLENLLAAWQEFLPGKRKKLDVQKFALHLMDNIILFHQELANKTYKHGGYQDFYINDPKPRHIHKASVRDRLLHHAVYRLLYPFFDSIFIANSFSCRLNKGTHRAIKKLQIMSWKVSSNSTKTCWILKCDIQKFFDSIDHKVLLEILQTYIPDINIQRLLQEIIQSFSVKPDKGLPLGNLTSQLFVNVYMNVFDQFVKHKLKAKHYIRYADDFVFLADSRYQLVGYIPAIKSFLDKKLFLILHPQKVELKTFASGVDFLGWVHFLHHRVLRTTSKKRMFIRLRKRAMPEALQSYLGLLKHGNTFKLQQRALNNYWLWQDKS